MKFFLPVSLLQKLWPHALPGVVQGVSDASTRILDKYKITELPQLIDFMAECSEETGGMVSVIESGAYSAERAHAVWPSLFPTIQSAQAVVGYPQALFNRVYGGRLGNIPNTNDGYNFRGRGMIQLTGRGWYAKIAEATGFPILACPDLVSDPEYILECAAAFWMLDDVNSTVGDFKREVKLINGGYTNMASRLAWEATCKSLLTLSAVAIPIGYANTAPVAQASPTKETSMFSFGTILSMLSAAPEVVKEFETLMADPGVQKLEALFGIHTTLVVTPGSAAVIEPIAAAVSAVAGVVKSL